MVTNTLFTYNDIQFSTSRQFDHHTMQLISNMTLHHNIICPLLRYNTRQCVLIDLTSRWYLSTLTLHHGRISENHLNVKRKSTKLRAFCSFPRECNSISGTCRFTANIYANLCGQENPRGHVTLVNFWRNGPTDKMRSSQANGSSSLFPPYLHSVMHALCNFIRHNISNNSLK